MLNSYPPNGPIPTLMGAQAPQSNEPSFIPKPFQPFQAPQQQQGGQNSMMNNALTNMLKNPGTGAGGTGSAESGAAATDATPGLFDSLGSGITSAVSGMGDAASAGLSDLAALFLL